MEKLVYDKVSWKVMPKAIGFSAPITTHNRHVFLEANWKTIAQDDGVRTFTEVPAGVGHIEIMLYVQVQESLSFKVGFYPLNGH